MLLKILSTLKKVFVVEEENEFPCPFTNKILSHSKELEWNVVLHSEEHITIGIALDDVRTQIVHIFDAGIIADKSIIQISSPAGSLKDIGNKMDQDFMNELLKLNADAPNYSWAIETLPEDDGDTDYLIASSDQLLETIDVGELAAAVYIVARAADGMEERFGLDNY